MQPNFEPIDRMIHGQSRNQSHVCMRYALCLTVSFEETDAAATPRRIETNVPVSGHVETHV